MTPALAVNRGAFVSIVDDDNSVRESLPALLRAFGFVARTFSSAEDFLSSDAVAASECVILEVGLPGMSGPDLYHEIRRRRCQAPVIFVTAQQNDTLRKRLLNQGAIACLFKPFDPEALVAALISAGGD